MKLEKFDNIKSINEEQFDALFQISKILNSATLTSQLVEKVLDLVTDVIKAERALFTRYSSKENRFTIIAARHTDKENILNLSDFSSGILQKVISEKCPQLYHDVQSDPNISQFESLQNAKIKSVLAVPIVYENEVWGVILADSKNNRKEFTEENLRFLEFFSSLVSLGLDKILQLENLEAENLILRNQLQAQPPLPKMIGQSTAMQKFYTLIRKVAQTEATVLILGESGTGKDLAARAVHELSKRNANPYLAQFCGNIPDTLLESELFGYKKGAFTGAATDKKGLFEVADRGSFFLDEISDISMALQAKLLRVIQNQEIIPLGDTSVRKVDVRIIAATNKDLNELVKNGEFREDLFYRLNVFPVVLPPLRERYGDIPLLAHYFLHKADGPAMHLDSAALKKLENYSWPGNVRQLENVLQRAQIMCDDMHILEEHIVLDEAESLINFAGSLKEFEKILLLNRLEKFNGNRTRTAESLNVSIRWIQLKLKEMSGD